MSNLHNTTPMGHLQSPAQLLALLEATIPMDSVVYAVGYGSGVVAQTSASTASTADRPRIDVLVVVDDALAFHTANVRRNPQHYPSIGASPAWAVWLQRHGLDRTTISWHHQWLGNPGFYFCVTDTLKYGIVQWKDVHRDLVDWSFLYGAGRLHKPVVEIVGSTGILGEHVHTAQHEHNLPAALAAALLLEYAQRESAHRSTTEPVKPPATSRVDLFQTIASLSYTGDPRMSLQAEDPDKVRHLVLGQVPRWNALYAPAAGVWHRAGLLDASTWAWDDANATAHERLWQSLPRSVRTACGVSHAGTVSHMRAAAHRLPLVLTSIVAPAARYQSLKGLVTAGVGPSAAYVWRKLSKGLLRQR